MISLQNHESEPQREGEGETCPTSPPSLGTTAPSSLSNLLGAMRLHELKFSNLTENQLQTESKVNKCDVEIK